MLDVLIANFDQSDRPYILFLQQQWLRWNLSAAALFTDPENAEFKAFLTQVDWQRAGRQMFEFDGETYIGNLVHADDHSILSLRPMQDATNSERVRGTLSRLQDLTLSLAEQPDLDELLRCAVQGGREVFQIDRIAIMLIDPQTRQLNGTYGTDPDGNVVDERYFVGDVPDLAEVQQVLQKRDYVAYWPSIELRYNSKVVGHGWSAMVALWDNDQAIGWISCDNLISQQPLASWQRQLFAFFGAALSQVIRRKRTELNLRQMNESLEHKVAQRTQTLRSKIDELEKTRDELIESEKLASLGSMVTGVAHEISTPLGNAKMACSWISEQIEVLDERVNDGSLTKSALQSFLKGANESSSILAANIDRSAELLHGFRSLAVEQLDERESVINLRSWFDQVIFSFGHLLKKHRVQVNNGIDPRVRLRTSPGLIGQIATNLLQNAITHAFADCSEPRIDISSKPAGDGRIHLFFADNGKGVHTDQLTKIFDPFYTTRRGQGGSGLGLNIVYNIVTGRLGGQLQARRSTSGGLEFIITISGALPHV
ncbi:GAF domain-containing sensor histidine kinase [Salinibius halmophilus]|uniref:GAF domain-containing sensor histidine kinase n=1 Tax=Salinibius halmophilus TaxID=1853216 RepID=UPI000E672ED7|nr:GAF domain-containing sensor histidine kinase [Salinibius halmophilus]